MAPTPEGMEKLQFPEKFRGDEELWWWHIELPGRLFVVRNGGAESRKAAEALAERADSRGWNVEFLTIYKEHSLVDMLGDGWGPDRWEFPPPTALSDIGSVKENSPTTPESVPAGERNTEAVPRLSRAPAFPTELDEDMPF